MVEIVNYLAYDASCAVYETTAGSLNLCSVCAAGYDTPTGAACTGILKYLRIGTISSCDSSCVSAECAGD